MTLKERVAYLEERVRQMEVEMGRMERDIAQLLRRGRNDWPYPPYRPLPPDRPDIIIHYGDEPQPYLKGNLPKRKYSRTGYGSK